MKKKFYLSFIFIVFLSTGKLFASHAAGAELSYQNLGGNSYRFYFKLYRDCIGIYPSTQYTIQGSSSNGTSVPVYLNLDSVAHIDQLCPSVVDQCVNSASPYTGIQLFYYHGDVTIPNGSAIWTFGSTPICNRNIAITNIIAPGSVCTYVEAKLNTNFSSNNSPLFNALPFFNLCDQTQYLHVDAYDVCT